MTTLDPTAAGPGRGTRRNGNRGGRARRIDPERLAIAAQRMLLGVVPVVVVGMLLVWVLSGSSYAVDFHYTYWPAGDRLLHGLSPYTADHAQIVGGWTFVYPALAALAFVPFALLSHHSADVIYMLLCLALVPATLVVLRVRDWRVYGASMLWLPVFGAWQTGNLTSPLLFAVALVWRLRDERPALAGAVAAVAVSLKPFVWPIVLWLILTRRWRASAWSLAVALAINLGAFAVVGFGAIGRYLHLSSAVTAALWRDGYGMLAIAGHLGFGATAGYVILASVSAALVLAMLLLARRGDDRRSIVTAVALMLVASPLVWSHYFALLLLPMAICIPRMSAVWLAPLLMWICPERTGVDALDLALAWVVAATCLYSPYRRAA